MKPSRRTFAHAATAPVALPPLAFLALGSSDELADATVYLRAFACKSRAPRNRRQRFLIATRACDLACPLDRLADARHHMVCDGDPPMTRSLLAYRGERG